MPPGKTADQLPESHFKRLVKSKGIVRVSRAIRAIKNLNRTRNKKRSQWAEKLEKKLSIWDKTGGRTKLKCKRVYKNPCPKKAVKKNPIEKFYPYRIYTYLLGKSKVFKGGRYVKGLKITNLSLELKPSFTKKMVLDALKYHNLIKPRLDDKSFDVTGDKLSFQVKYKGTPEFELRRDDI